MRGFIDYAEYGGLLLVALVNKKIAFVLIAITKLETLQGVEIRMRIAVVSLALIGVIVRIYFDITNGIKKSKQKKNK